MMTAAMMTAARAARTIEADLASAKRPGLAGGLGMGDSVGAAGAGLASKGNGMNRRVFLGRCAGGVIGAVFLATAALADSFQSAVVAQLRSQGYREINVERTMLGRVRIVAARRGASREIILNPRTGEILRDVVLAADGQVAPQISGGDGSGKGSTGDDGSGDDGSGDDGSGDDGSGDDGSGDDGSDDGDSSGEGDGKGGSGKDGGGKEGGDDSED